MLISATSPQLRDIDEEMSVATGTSLPGLDDDTLSVASMVRQHAACLYSKAFIAAPTTSICRFICALLHISATRARLLS